MNDIWARILHAWNDLSGRERLLLSSAGAVVALMAVYMLAINPFLTASTQAQELAQSAELQLEAMVKMRGQYDAIQQRLVSVEERIHQDKKRRNMLTLLESLASKAAAKVDSMQEKRGGTNDAYREKKVEVSLKNVTLEQTVNYLYSIESADQLFTIKSMRIRTRSDGSNLLDVTFTVSSFEPT
ncbi:MAG: type II secretion system protein GspM [Myxococcota bacterium]